jgi:LysM repeat protein
MNNRSSVSARVFAVAALVIAFVIAIVAISGSLGGDDSNGSDGGNHGSSRQSHEAPPKHVPASYEVESGDTLISIAHRTGVPVVTIEKLNPEVDPQSLIVGEQLKLR